LAQARNLRQQITQNGEGNPFGDNLSLQLLKTQVYATVGEGTLPGNLNFDLGGVLSVESEVALADVDALIATLDGYSSELTAQIDELSRQLLSGEGYAYLENFSIEAAGFETENDVIAALNERYLDLFRVGGMARVSEETSETSATEGAVAIIRELDQEIQLLRAEFAAEDSRRLLLVQKRDIAWTILSTLRNKVAELSVARTAANSEVRLVSPAVTPLGPVPPSISSTLIVVASALFAFGIAVFIAMVATFAGQRPWLSRLQRAS
jgi:hypothetical protein